MNRRALLAGCAAAFFVRPGHARAAGADAGYPNRQITIVVPFAPGGSNDVLSRILQQGLQDIWKQTIIVENRTGAGGNLAAAAVARAKPDGYTLIMGSIGTHAVNGLIYKSVKHDMIRDFTPVILAAKVELALVVHPSLPVNSVAELIDYAEKNPLNYASGGIGASQHLAGEMFKKTTNVEATHIPYQGSGAAIADLLGGQVPVMFADMPLVASAIKTGKLRALATCGAKRSPALDVPTMQEAGVNGFEAYAWYGLFATAGTPKEIVSKLNAAANQVYQSPENRKKLEEMGAGPEPNTPEQFAAFQQSEVDKWTPLVKPLQLDVN